MGVVSILLADGDTVHVMTTLDTVVLPFLFTRTRLTVFGVGLQEIKFPVNMSFFQISSLPVIDLVNN
jgi:hypothetical protein